MLIPLILLGVAVILGIVIFISQNSNEEAKEIKRLKALVPQKTKSGKNKNVSPWISLYNFFDRFLWLNSMQERTRSRLMNIQTGFNNDATELASRVTLFSILACTGFILSGVLFATNIYQYFSFIFAGIFIFFWLTDIFVIGRKIKSMHAQDRFMDRLSDSYSDTRSPLKSLSDLANDLPPDEAIHAETLHEVLTSRGPETEEQVALAKEAEANGEVVTDWTELALENYLDNAPNQHMKLLAEVSHSTVQYGDSEGEEKSEYLAAIARIQGDLRRDILNEEKMRKATRFSALLTVSPVFFVEISRKFVSESIPQLAPFYESIWGYISMVVIYLSLMIGLYVVRFVMSIDDSTQGLKNEGRIMQFLLDIPGVTMLMSRIVPLHRNTKRSQKIVDSAEGFLKMANSRLTVHQFYMSRLVTSVFAFVIVSALMFNGVTVYKEVLLDKGAYDLQTLTNSDYIIKSKRTHESEIVQKYPNRGLSDKELYTIVYNLSEDKRFAYSDTTLEEYTEMMVAKVRSYENAKFYWYFYIIAFVVATIANFLPLVILSVKKVLRDRDMNKEVQGFNSIMFIVYKMDHVTIYEVLNWLHRYSDIFREPLSDLISNYYSGVDAAFEEAKEATGFHPFIRILDRLHRASDTIGLDQAFANLSGDREYEVEKQKRLDEAATDDKIATIKFVAIIPAATLGGLYMLLPFALMLIDIMLSGTFDVPE